MNTEINVDKCIFATMSSRTQNLSFNSQPGYGRIKRLMSV